MTDVVVALSAFITRKASHAGVTYLAQAGVLPPFYSLKMQLGFHKAALQDLKGFSPMHFKISIIFYLGFLYKPGGPDTGLYKRPPLCN